MGVITGGSGDRRPRSTGVPLVRALSPRSRPQTGSRSPIKPFQHFLVFSIVFNAGELGSVFLCLHYLGWAGTVACRPGSGAHVCPGGHDLALQRQQVRRAWPPPGFTVRAPRGSDTVSLEGRAVAE